MEPMSVTHFVNTYIRNERRRRLLYELTEPKKQYDGLSRFCHSSASLLNPKKIVLRSTSLEHDPEFLRFLSERDEPVRILSPDASINETTEPLKEGVIKAVMCLDAAILLGSTFAIVFGEAEQGGRDGYLLLEDPAQTRFKSN